MPLACRCGVGANSGSGGVVAHNEAGDGVLVTVLRLWIDGGRGHGNSATSSNLSCSGSGSEWQWPAIRRLADDD